MKLIHFADLHIGSKFERMPDDIRKELNSKLRNAFSYIIQYARKNGITTILMSGDIFDKDAVLMADKKFFYDSIKENPGMDFYYIKGNHDSRSKCLEEIDNLHTFSGLESYEKENVRIIGYELSQDNLALYDAMPLTKDKYNIMMLHGDIHNPRDKNYIDIQRLQNKNIRYFALGHIHKWEQEILEDNAKLQYPGCVMGRGFDEVGEKGFAVLDTDKDSTYFVPFSDILFEQFTISVNGMNEAKLKQEISNHLAGTKKKVITEIRLTGKAEQEIDTEDLIRTFRDERYYLTFRNLTKLALNYQPNERENSLRNMFINQVLKDPTMDDDTKEKVISYGLSKLMKEEA